MSTIGVTTVNGTFVYIYDPELKEQSPHCNPVHSMSVKSKAGMDEQPEVVDIFFTVKAYFFQAKRTVL
jgi:hypothetical protein